MAERRATPPQRRVRATVLADGLGEGYLRSLTAVALELGLTGWAQPHPDGHIDFVAEGDSDAVAELLRWAPKGPDTTTTAKVIVTDEMAQSDLHSFELREAHPAHEQQPHKG